jgi:Leucine Rich repeat
MPDEAKPRTRVWRRLLRFSTRRSIIAVFVFAVALSWPARRAHFQRDLVASIGIAGGSVKYDWEWSDGKSLPGAKPPAPEQVAEFIGIDFFGQVKAVELFPSGRYVRDSTATDRKNFESALKSVAHLPGVQHVDLLASRVNDADLTKLNGLKDLTHLDLNWTEITDAGLARLSAVLNLKRLFLHRAPITDAGLAQLKKFPKLERLHLGFTRITDDGLAELERLKCLTHLDLTGTAVTDRGLVHVARLNSLKSLKLSRTKVTDLGLVQLKTLENLAALELCETQINGAAIPELEQSLRYLTIRLRYH